jgi:hypothetical protein
MTHDAKPSRRKRKRAYSPRTVLAAQRRVLKLVRGYLGAPPETKRMMLIADDRSFTTISDLLDQIDAAVDLKVWPDAWDVPWGGMSRPDRPGLRGGR